MWPPCVILVHQFDLPNFSYDVTSSPDTRVSEYVVDTNHVSLTSNWTNLPIFYDKFSFSRPISYFTFYSFIYVQFSPHFGSMTRKLVIQISKIQNFPCFMPKWLNLSTNSTPIPRRWESIVYSITFHFIGARRLGPIVGQTTGTRIGQIWDFNYLCWPTGVKSDDVIDLCLLLPILSDIWPNLAALSHSREEMLLRGKQCQNPGRLSWRGVRFSSEVGQISPKWDKSGTFSDQI